MKLNGALALCSRCKHKLSHSLNHTQIFTFCSVLECWIQSCFISQPLKVHNISLHSPQTAELSLTHSYFSQVLQNVLNYSNKISLCKPEGGQQNSSLKVEANGGSSPVSDTSTDSKFTPPESQSPLHFLADLAEQKSREEKKGGYRNNKTKGTVEVTGSQGPEVCQLPLCFSFLCRRVRAWQVASIPQSSHLVVYVTGLLSSELPQSKEFT